MQMRFKNKKSHYVKDVTFLILSEYRIVPPI